MRHFHLVVAVLMFLAACGDDDATPPEVKIDAAVTTPECTSNPDCEDGNDCTLDTCDQGVCKHVADTELEEIMDVEGISKEKAEALHASAQKYVAEKRAQEAEAAQSAAAAAAASPAEESQPE